MLSHKYKLNNSLLISAMAAASVLLLFTSTFSILLPLTLSEPFDQPTTANLSTLWTLNSSLASKVNYPDGSSVLPLLVRGKSDLAFVFGFFCYAPCSAFLLSIYIVYTGSSINLFEEAPRIVWSTNRDLPVHLKATLLFSSDGNLILRDADGSFVWSANTSGQDAETLDLLGSGNLVDVDRARGQLWASFDHTTDSLLIGQSLRQGQRLTANSSRTNVTRGQLYLEILDVVGLRAFVDSNPPQLYYKQRDGPSEPQNGSSISTFANGTLSIPGAFGYSIALYKASSFQYLRLEDDGHLRQYDWDIEWKILGDVFLVHDDGCSYPTVCGQYGICSNGQCSCPQGADGDSNNYYFKPVNSREISLGCSAVT